MSKDIPDEFKRSVEYGAGDEWSVEGWTIREQPEYVDLDAYGSRKLMRRVVYYGPWEEYK